MSNALSLNVESRESKQDEVTMGWIRRLCCTPRTQARTEDGFELTEREILEDLDYGR